MIFSRCLTSIGLFLSDNISTTVTEPDTGVQLHDEGIDEDDLEDDEFPFCTCM